jgi:hypothetical protein
MNPPVVDEGERYKHHLRKRWRALRRLGVRNIRCYCGETDPVCFEAEHVDRRAKSDVVFGVCKNCHAKITARQMSTHPGVGLYPGNPLAHMAHRVFGIVEYLSFITDLLREVAELLIKLAGQGITPED